MSKWTCPRLARQLVTPAAVRRAALDCRHGRRSRPWSEAEVDAGRGPAGALTSEEREELSRLCKEKGQAKLSLAARGSLSPARNRILRGPMQSDRREEQLVRRLRS